MRCSLIGAVVLGFAAPSIVAGAESEPNATASAAVVVSADFSTRTSLKVSSDVLQFVVGGAEETAETAVDFSAAARTRGGGEVILVVEPLEAVGAGAEVTVAAQGHGTRSGTLPVNGATPVARWTGSGQRTGRLTFTLRAAPGRYLVPIRFLLSAP